MGNMWAPWTLNSAGELDIMCPSIRLEFYHDTYNGKDLVLLLMEEILHYLGCKSS